MRDVRRAGIAVDGTAGGGTLLTERVLVVSQKAKLIEVNADYAIFDQLGQDWHGSRGRPEPHDEGGGARSEWEQRLQIIDANGGLLMTLTRPATLLKSKVIVRDPSGGEIGQIVQKNLGIFGAFQLHLGVRGQAVGAITGEDWNAWNFSVEDDARNEVARIGKSWAGLAKEVMFSKKDNYVVQINRPLADPMRSLVVAAALAIDTVLRQGQLESPRLSKGRG